jgi:hypothetical protein
MSDSAAPAVVPSLDVVDEVCVVLVTELTAMMVTS